VTERRFETVEYGSRRWIIAICIALAPLLETIDSTIVNVALPQIGGNLGASLDESAFVITAYLVSNVIVIPLTPWFAKRLGRRQYLTLSIAGFVAASVACGFATTIWALVAMRFVQGFFGGGLIATTQSALRDLFPIESANVSQAIFGVCIALGPILGPLLGGVIVDNLSWPWIFYVNIVPGTIAGVVAATMLRNPEEPKRLGIDVPGIAFLAIGVAALQYLLDEGERKDWFDSPVICTCAVVAAVGLAAFIVRELRVRQPIVDLRALRDRSIWSGCLLGAGFGTTLIGVNFILPQYLQGTLAFTPTLSGQWLLFRGVPVVLLAPAIGAMLGNKKIDPRLLIAFGLLCTGLGTGWLGMRTTAGSDFGTLVWPLVLAGVGTAFLIIPLLTVVVSSVSDEIAPAANAFVTLSIQLGGSISSAVVVTILDRRQQWHSDILAGNTTQHAPELARAFAGKIGALFSLIQDQAYVLAYADIAFLVSAVAFALIPFVAIVRRPPEGKAGEPVYEFG
jgi:DHA2 family multidrug resistance protein